MDGAFSMDGAGARDHEIKHAMPGANFSWDNKRKRSDTGALNIRRIFTYALYKFPLLLERSDESSQFAAQNKRALEYCYAINRNKKRARVYSKEL